MPENNSTQLLIFTKAPIPGQVKTRLIPALSAAAAAELHIKLLAHTLEQVKTLTWRKQLWCAPDTQHPLFATYQQQFNVSLHQQIGEDLGARMQHAFATAFKQAEQVIIIGSDCPAIDHQYLVEAQQSLNHKTPVVLGPAEDGGYVLIGLQRTDPAKLQKTFTALFNEMPWSQPNLLRLTINQLHTANIGCQCLTTKRDVDTLDDLAWLTRQHSLLLSQ
ncbi:MAG: TIGR04282 family arsenosugar biosynthesis glycosyltransferase [Gammaproteobacteria bacterium]|nr:TIGR04282 family arsenosugar biosynthesis glycosyltransferase [Gammaproteobacteria bacterium]